MTNQNLNLTTPTSTQPTPSSSHATNHHHLRNSWIINPSSAFHVCNDTMSQRFIKEADCTDSPRTFMTGSGITIPITAYGKVDINVRTPTGDDTITLQDVIFAPSFATNIISGSKLQDQEGAHFDTRYHHVHRNGVTLFNFTPKGGYYLVEDNTAASQSNASAAEGVTAKQQNNTAVSQSKASFAAAQGLKKKNKKATTQQNKELRQQLQEKEQTIQQYEKESHTYATEKAEMQAQIAALSQQLALSSPQIASPLSVGEESVSMRTF